MLRGSGTPRAILNALADYPEQAVEMQAAEEDSLRMFADEEAA